MRRDSYLPSSPATLQALDRMEYTMTNAIASPDVGIIGPHILMKGSFGRLSRTPASSAQDRPGVRDNGDSLPRTPSSATASTL